MDIGTRVRQEQATDSAETGRACVLPWHRKHLAASHEHEMVLVVTAAGLNLNLLIALSLELIAAAQAAPLTSLRQL